MKKTPSGKTGPNTSAGKANSSKNSTKHGLCGNPDKFFPNETQEQYNAVRDTWFAEYESESPGTVMLLDQLINCDRQVRFSTKVVRDVEIALYEAENASERNETRIESLQKDLTLKLRYKTQHERSFQRAFRNIEQFGQRRVREELAVRRIDILELKAACQTAILCKKNGIAPELMLLATDSLPDAAQPEPASAPEGAQKPPL
ncbi:MAG: hypothetical protein M3Y57_14620 [Acidobacteriota bacterium]|nr:hypothetical protein [Acidobacteriota bacterium]